MPIYEFKCTNCEHGFEELFFINEVLPTDCKHCKQNTMKQIIGKPADWFPHSSTFNGRLPQGNFQKTFAG